jgi:hypothetical protein
MNEKRQIERRPLEDNEIDNGDPRLTIHPYFTEDRFVRVDRFINILGRQFPIERVSSVREIWPSANGHRFILKSFEIASSGLKIVGGMAILLTIYAFFGPVNHIDAAEFFNWIPYPSFLASTHLSMSASDKLVLVDKFVLVVVISGITALILARLQKIYSFFFLPNYIEVMLDDGHIERFRYKIDGGTDGNYSIFSWAHHYMSGSAFVSDRVPIVCDAENFEATKSNLRGWPRLNPAQMLQLNIKTTKTSFHLTSVSPLRFGSYVWIEAVVLGRHGVEIIRGREMPLEFAKDAILDIFNELSGAHGLKFINGHGEHFLKVSAETINRIKTLRGSRPNPNI